MASFTAARQAFGCPWQLLGLCSQHRYKAISAGNAWSLGMLLFSMLHGGQLPFGTGGLRRNKSSHDAYAPVADAHEPLGAQQAWLQTQLQVAPVCFTGFADSIH